MAQSARMQQLTAALRATASRASSATGGCALLFAALPGEDAGESPARLRAAAGFSSADEARSASQSVMPEVRDTLASPEPRLLGPIAALGPRAAGNATALPLGFEDRTHGVLIVASPTAIDESTQLLLGQLAGSAAVHVDHLHVLAELDGVRENATESKSLADQKNDD